MSAEKPFRISIVTPSFNQGAFIEEAIRSVFTQEYPDVEHIIVDNCSTDTTADVLSRYPHLKVIREPDEGQSDALNKGFEAATGDIVGWLNADDAYAPGSFGHMVRAFLARAQTDIVYGDYRLIDADGRLIRRRRELPFDMFMLKYLHVLYIPTTTTFFRRKIFTDGNFLDIRYHYAMDYEFFVRLAARGYRFEHIPQFLADFRWHEEAKSQKYTLRQKEEMERALFVLDPFLSGTKGAFRPFIRAVLMILARAKRYILKFVRGAYR